MASRVTSPRTPERTMTRQRIALVSIPIITSALVLLYRHRRREQASHWVEEVEETERDQEDGAPHQPSILAYFKDMALTEDMSVDLANKRRTTRYYELARDAHEYNLVPGIRSYPRLRNLRETEMERIYKYWNLQQQTALPKSHRTVLAMCDARTAQLLAQARDEILEPLQYTTDMTTEGCWIPEANLIPECDMHVTVAIPWWWHTIRPGNRELSEEFVARFRQALVLQFHHPFQVELERIVLLGGKTLVALWRTVGERITEDGECIFDRHGEDPDPFVRLRKDIVRSFTATGAFQTMQKEPLTYNHRFFQSNNEQSATLPEATPPRESMSRRENSIELKTPGIGGKDGFIHTTLARLPLECFSMSDVELAPIHRMCREATASYCGHRLVISKFRFLETVGAGGTSNPCVNPIFDETVAAPPRMAVQENGGGAVYQVMFSKQTGERNATIGAVRGTEDRTTVQELFPGDDDDNAEEVKQAEVGMSQQKRIHST